MDLVIWIQNILFYELWIFDESLNIFQKNIQNNFTDIEQKLHGMMRIFY